MPHMVEPEDQLVHMTDYMSNALNKHIDILLNSKKKYTYLKMLIYIYIGFRLTYQTWCGAHACREWQNHDLTMFCEENPSTSLWSSSMQRVAAFSPIINPSALVGVRHIKFLTLSLSFSSWFIYHPLQSIFMSLSPVGLTDSALFYPAQAPQSHISSLACQACQATIYNQNMCNRVARYAYIMMFYLHGSDECQEKMGLQKPPEQTPTMLTKASLVLHVI